MSIDYYYKTSDPSITSNGIRPPIQIGRSSGGWCFALFVYPNILINNLEDWIDVWLSTDGYIVNEYSENVPIDTMLSVIKNRNGRRQPSVDERFLEDNYADLGPNNLLRAKKVHNCIGWGEGTWDYFDGNIS